LGSQSLDHAGEFSLDSRATSLIYLMNSPRHQTICCYDASYCISRFFSTRLSTVDSELRQRLRSDAAVTGLLANQRRAGTEICPRGCCVPASALKARRLVKSRYCTKMPIYRFTNVSRLITASPSHRWRTIPERGVVRSRKLLKFCTQV